MTIKEGTSVLLYCDDVSSINDEQLDLLFGLMPIERQKKAMRYVKKEDKCLSAVVYSLLAYALRSKGCEISDYQLLTAKNGKPYLLDCPFEFSLSHTKNAVACAVSQGKIGVDIQYKYPDYIRAMNRACSENEIKYISNSKNPVDDFTKVWTLKESYVKYKGTGISDSLSEYDFSDVIECGGSAYECEFSLLGIGEYAVSVCADYKIEQVKKVSISELCAFYKRI